MSNTEKSAIAKSEFQRKKHIRCFGLSRKYVTEPLEFLQRRQESLDFLSGIVSNIKENIWNSINCFFTYGNYSKRIHSLL